jgi:hypothetical protein
MSARKQNDDVSFSSDSFMDVVCNLVGILIVLIVVAGLRISRAPVHIEPEEPSPVAAAQQPAPEVVVAEPEPIAEPESIVPEPLPPPPAQPPVELITRADDLRTRMLSLEADINRARLERSELQARQRSSQARLVAVRTEAGSATARLSAAEQSLADQDAAIAAQERRLAALKHELQREAEAEPQGPVLAHRVTPIGRQIGDEVEVHYRLSGDRVSVVPIDALAEDLKARVQRNSDMLFRVPRYEGSIGPVEGYTMHYVIERQQPNALEELRGGPVMRIGLSYYEIEPKPDAPTESYDEAVLPRSRFRAALAQAGSGAVITFWVYPDSFELNRRLQDLLHSSGYEVAARPLPDGVPIAGSPNGSKSVAQ